MPAGFGSRLREKIESTRSNYNSSSTGGGSGAGGLGASKNIRGLTRLSGSTAPPNSAGSAPKSGGGDASLTAEPQGGLLARKPVGDTPSSPDKSAIAKSAAGGVASSTAASSSADSGAALNSPSVGSTPTAASTALGGSKIVPGWGAATSGHLGGIKSKNSAKSATGEQQQQQQSPLAGSVAVAGGGGKNVPWAMHQPPSTSSAQSSPQNNSVNYQSSQKPRWGDEDDDSDDDEFPQIGTKPPQTNTSSTAAAAANSLHQQQQYRGAGEEPMSGGGGVGGYNNHYGGGGGRYSDHNNRDYQQSRRSYNDRYSNDRHENDHYNNHRDYHHHSQRGSYSNHRDDYSRGHGDDRGFRDFAGPRGGGGGGGGGYDNRPSHHRDDYNDNRRSSSSSFYNDKRFYNDDQSPTQTPRNDSRWGFAQRAPSHFSDRRSSEDYQRHRSGSGHEGGFDNNVGHHEYRSSRRGGGGFEGERGGYNDREGSDRYGFGSSGRREDTHRGGEDGRARSRSSSMASNNQDHRAEDALKQQLGIDANERINRSAPETPMLLLRNNNNGSTGAQGANQPSGEVSRENDAEMNAAKIEGNAVGGNRVWAPALPVEPTPLSLDQTQASEQITAVLPPSPVKQRSPEEEAQYKKDQAIEQQQSILRQVAERRAARVSRTESEISADESKSEPAEKWKRGQKVASDRSGDETQILGKKTNPCRKKGHDHDWADCPDNRSSNANIDKAAKKTADKTDKAERGNPCRKPGHDHDWKHCPDNRLSEEYAAKMEEKKERKIEKEKRKEEKQQQQQTQPVEKPRPCRIEGHDHDWRECPKNPKSENFIRDNPCQIEGHDHDWVDCPDNPKSENYRPPKRKSKKAPKRASAKDVQENNDSDVEEKVNDDTKEKIKPRSKKHEDLARKRREESRSLAKDSEEVQVKDVPIEPESVEATEENEPKEFVPAPPPKVPAWSSGPPASIKKTSLSSSEPADESEPASVNAHVEEAPILPSPAPAVAQHQVPGQHAQNIPQPPQVEHHDISAFSPSQHVPPTTSNSNHTAQSDSATQSTMQSQPILPPPNALFPGNSALFGESQGSAVYGSWNPPPMVLPSTYVDPWKPNPFAPTTSTTPSIGASLGGIWSGSAAKPSNAPASKDLGGMNKVAAVQATNSENAPALNENTKKIESNGDSGSTEAASVPADDEIRTGKKKQEAVAKASPGRKRWQRKAWQRRKAKSLP
mmetsp:Transcript_26029/g.44202  ORF Transcript_26029/g.44202 Transcript_26029/m.44202 type:complete len:1214 (-) Transcript_26029:472-4113(-)